MKCRGVKQRTKVMTRKTHTSCTVRRWMRKKRRFEWWCCYVVHVHVRSKCKRAMKMYGDKMKWNQMKKRGKKCIYILMLLLREWIWFFLLLLLVAYLVHWTVEAMPTAAFAFNIFFRLTFLARQTAHWFRRFWLMRLKLHFCITFVCVCTFHPCEW